MGITTPLSTNPAMTIGGLTVGVTPLDMAHAYETIAHGGRRVSGTLAEDDAPVAIQEVDAGSHKLPDGAHHDVNQVRTTAVLPPEVAATETTMLETVLQYGTAKAAAIGEFAAGKTGTTSNYGDAWFVGWNHKYTVAVWVGYPNSLVPMTTEFNGTPVLGGTFPALIWHDFMTSALSIEKARAEHIAHPKGPSSGSGAGTSSTGESETSAPSSSSTNRRPPGATPRAVPARAAKARAAKKPRLRAARATKPQAEAEAARGNSGSEKEHTASSLGARAGIPERAILPRPIDAGDPVLPFADGGSQSGGLGLAKGALVKARSYTR